MSAEPCLGEIPDVPDDPDRWADINPARADARSLGVAVLCRARAARLALGRGRQPMTTDIATGVLMDTLPPLEDEAKRLRAAAEQLLKHAINVDLVVNGADETEEDETTNPTNSKFAALLAEWHASRRDDSDDARFQNAHAALRAARPTDPTALAALLRFLATGSSAGDDPRDRAVIEHVAEQLEAMAGGVVLSADAAAQIGDALRGAYDALARLDPVAKRDLIAMAELPKALALVKRAGRAAA